MRARKENTERQWGVLRKDTGKSQVKRIRNKGGWSGWESSQSRKQVLLQGDMRERIEG